MGTTFTVKVVGGVLSEERQQEILELIESELEGINQKMSHYLEDSELSRFNRHREPTPFPVSAETFEVFRHARELSALSGGAFDITVGALVNAWGFGPVEREIERPPSEEEIALLLQQVGYTEVELDPMGRTLKKSSPMIFCDLSAIAKGYAVDRVAEALEGEGITDYMVEVGGEVRTKGVNDGGVSWRIGIERPVSDSRVLQQVIPLSGWAMATSGDYRNFYEVDGVRVSHTIDPRTGLPLTHRLASVSVVEELAVRADGLATALMVLGPDEGYSLAVDHGLAALFLIHDEGGGFRERASPAFQRLLRLAEE